MLAGNAFGDAEATIVIEEFLDGEEASFIVMVDGERRRWRPARIINASVMAIPVRIPAVWALLPARW
jgi:hypothetical protein